MKNKWSKWTKKTNKNDAISKQTIEIKLSTKETVYKWKVLLEFQARCTTMQKVYIEGKRSQASRQKETYPKGI